MSGEAASRSDIGLPSNQQDLLKALAKNEQAHRIGPYERPAIDVALGCGALQRDPGNVVWGTRIRQRRGRRAVWRLQSFRSAECDISARCRTNSALYNHKNTGRPYGGDPRVKYVSRYLDVANTPLFPFGYGLSYTTFSYGDVKLSQRSLKGDETLVASVEVTNTGQRPGEETVQLYITDPVRA